MFRFNPDAWDAWADAIRRHQRQGEGEPLAAMIRSGKPMPPEAREYIAAIAASTAKRGRGAQPKTIDPARIYRDRRIQAAVLKNMVKRIAVRDTHERELEPPGPTKRLRDKPLTQRSREDERVVIHRVAQDEAVLAVVEAIQGTPDELKRTAVSDIARRIVEPEPEPPDEA